MSSACVAGLICMHCAGVAAAVHHPTRRDLVYRRKNHETSVRAADLPSIIFEAMKIVWIMECGYSYQFPFHNFYPFSETLWVVALLI